MNGDYCLATSALFHRKFTQSRKREVEPLWLRLADFRATPITGGAGGLPSAIVLKLSVPPSRLVEMLNLVLTANPKCAIQAHAGNGVAIVKFAEFSATDVSKTLIGSLQPAAQRAWGKLRRAARGESR